jgi:hypothetical protein
LENFHVASAFEIMDRGKSIDFDGKPLYQQTAKSCNIFEKFNKSRYKIVREKMIAFIFSTDMTKHFSSIGNFKSRQLSSKL